MTEFGTLDCDLEGLCPTCEQWVSVIGCPPRYPYMLAPHDVASGDDECPTWDKAPVELRRWE